MLLQSRTGEIELLPALPPAWRQGSVSGLRARGGFTVGLKWRESALTEATVLSTNGAPCSVRARTPFQVGAARSRAEGADQVLTFNTTAAQTHRLTAAR